LAACLATCLAIGVPAAAGADEALAAPPSAQELARWIAQLGDDDYAVRQQASLRLLEAGPAAESALRPALSSRDPEVRDRAQRLLAAIRQREQHRRLVAFLAHQGDDDDPRLGGWSLFRRLAGDSRASRQWFAQMYRAEASLLDQLNSDSQQAILDAYNRRLTALQEDRARAAALLPGAPSGAYDVPAPSVAALLLVAADPRIPAAALDGASLYSLVQQPTMYQELSAGTHRELLLRLLDAVVGREFSTQLAYQHCLLAMQYDLKSALEPARKFVTRQDVPSSTRLYAVLAIGKLGTADDLEVLRPLLDDATQCWVWQIGKQRYSLQLRDAALAASIHLSGGNPRDFGFARLQGNPQMLFAPHSLGFADDQERAAALRAWQSSQRRADNAGGAAP
jgi:hypothetical protein